MCSNVDGSQGHWAKWKMPVSNDHVLCNKFKNVLARCGLQTGPTHNSLLIWELNLFAFLEQCIKIKNIILQIYHQPIITYRMSLNATQNDMNKRGSPTVNADAPGVRMHRNKTNTLKGRFPGSSGSTPKTENMIPRFCAATNEEQISDWGDTDRTAAQEGSRPVINLTESNLVLN